MVLKHQLKEQGKSKLIIEGVEVYFEKCALSGGVLIKGSIPFCAKDLTLSVHETLKNLDAQALHKASAKIEIYAKEGYALFVQKTIELDSFVSFENTIKAFMKIFHFWSSIVEDVLNSQKLLAF